MAEETEQKAVYHYTSMAAMMSIVDTKSIWCTAISYLNDATEREFLVRAVRERLPELQRLDPDVDAQLSMDDPPIEDIIRRVPLAGEVFVASFAAQDDSLMHWRSYCPQQSGIAIGFRTECLDAARINETPQAGMLIPNSGFERVRYINANDEDQVDKVIRRAQLVARMNFGAHPSHQMTLAEYFRAAVEAIACSSKHASFEIEGEYRLLLGGVAYRENNLKFRPVRSTLVPYVEMRVPARHELSHTPMQKPTAWDAIERVVIGPTANMDLTQAAVKSFFGIRRMDVEVDRSIIPYRDW